LKLSLRHSSVVVPVLRRVVVVDGVGGSSQSSEVVF